jgi:hypothetical protein
MVAFSELQGIVPNDPAIESEHLRSLWVMDYDIEPTVGVRSGMVLFRGERCAYQLVATREDEYGVRGQFAVLRLSREQLEQEVKWHEQLVQQVGDGKELEWFIERYREREKPDYSACEVLGWFEPA